MILASNGIIASQIALGPVATAATGVGMTSFTANWNTYTGAQYYLLDVSTSSSFSTFVYQDQVVLAPTTSYVVIGLTENTTYYYRLRASTDAVPITATGGTITYSGGRTIHTFTSSGTFTVLTAPLAAEVEALVVAGGGGGGSFSGGGGGAGGLLYDAAKSISITAYTITVGSGGVKPTNDAGGNTNGNNSVFDSLTAIGGGRGGVNTSNDGKNGGSGGGANGASATGGTATSGQGNNGGGAITGTNSGSGGGGAGAIGSNAVTTTGGNGGNGITNSINGTSTYYAGGGGGSSAGGTIGTGGNGGGGNGELYNLITAATNGTANTGGGGGGMYLYNAANGGNGGSGIVIISYPT